jgi:hypothetical protein
VRRATLDTRVPLRLFFTLTGSRRSGGGAWRQGYSRSLESSYWIVCWVHAKVCTCVRAYDTSRTQNKIQLKFTMSDHNYHGRNELVFRLCHIYCPTRWWSKWEGMYQLMLLMLSHFSDPKICCPSPATKSKLLSIISDPDKSVCLQLELAASMWCWWITCKGNV